MVNKILIIEDEKNISNSLKLILENEGFIVTIKELGTEGLACYSQHDLMILDLMLPDIDGIEVLKQIRKINLQYPILIVSAKTKEDDLVNGLSLGADDYITKPFSINELLMRIKRALQRQQLYEHKTNHTASQMKSYSFGKNTIDFVNLKASTEQGERDLTSQEVQLLLVLFKNEGKIISRTSLMEEIWGHSRDIESRTIDNFIVRFRKYFEPDPKNPKHILTKRGQGYLFLN
ncbi:MAG: hypothetical protein A2381_05360 [Bdellovibrionales bacterium RIFOXYB1_FULL_37_110]|nr:MAG: hypothetical protein A2417_16840 [Bdellovibrionales bacterium RIFOXYC1_FULL_37_79]OFZ58174.1 MAG: hypothetical protein A2381_05360 [Bdellovibrionales bacterium RIFOXYB1_FULL_37_110]OFZ61863.1 MAG: hypothetical protein A2577_18945 [Bdellovibrionales bacterium RIFOXYD1_FULL_36_51]